MLLHHILFNSCCVINRYTCCYLQCTRAAILYNLRSHNLLHVLQGCESTFSKPRGTMLYIMTRVKTQLLCEYLHVLLFYNMHFIGDPESSLYPIINRSFYRRKTQ